jgi:hypothetical protein
MADLPIVCVDLDSITPCSKHKVFGGLSVLCNILLDLFDGQGPGVVAVIILPLFG